MVRRALMAISEVTRVPISLDGVPSPVSSAATLSQLIQWSETELKARPALKAAAHAAERVAAWCIAAPTVRELIVHADAVPALVALVALTSDAEAPAPAVGSCARVRARVKLMRRHALLALAELARDANAHAALADDAFVRSLRCWLPPMGSAEYFSRPSRLAEPELTAAALAVVAAVASTPNGATLLLAASQLPSGADADGFNICDRAACLLLLPESAPELGVSPGQLSIMRRAAAKAVLALTRSFSGSEAPFPFPTGTLDALLALLQEGAGAIGEETPIVASILAEFVRTPAHTQAMLEAPDFVAALVSLLAAAAPVSEDLATATCVASLQALLRVAAGVSGPEVPVAPQLAAISAAVAPLFAPNAETQERIGAAALKLLHRLAEAGIEPDLSVSCGPGNRPLVHCMSALLPGPLARYLAPLLARDAAGFASVPSGAADTIAALAARDVRPVDPLVAAPPIERPADPAVAALALLLTKAGPPAAFVAAGGPRVLVGALVALLPTLADKAQTPETASAHAVGDVICSYVSSLVKENTANATAVPMLALDQFVARTPSNELVMGFLLDMADVQPAFNALTGPPRAHRVPICLPAVVATACGDTALAVAACRFLADYVSAHGDEAAAAIAATVTMDTAAVLLAHMEAPHARIADYAASFVPAVVRAGPDRFVPADAAGAVASVLSRHSTPAQVVGSVATQAVRALGALAVRPEACAEAAPALVCALAAIPPVAPVLAECADAVRHCLAVDAAKDLALASAPASLPSALADHIIKCPDASMHSVTRLLASLAAMPAAVPLLSADAAIANGLLAAVSSPSNDVARAALLALAHISVSEPVRAALATSSAAEVVCAVAERLSPARVTALKIFHRVTSTADAASAEVYAAPDANAARFISLLLADAPAPDVRRHRSRFISCVDALAVVARAGTERSLRAAQHVAEAVGAVEGALPALGAYATALLEHRTPPGFPADHETAAAAVDKVVELLTRLSVEANEPLLVAARFPHIAALALTASQGQGTWAGVEEALRPQLLPLAVQAVAAAVSSADGRLAFAEEVRGAACLATLAKDKDKAIRTAATGPLALFSSDKAAKKALKAAHAAEKAKTR
jgi:hypothetical protein